MGPQLCGPPPHRLPHLPLKGFPRGTETLPIRLAAHGGESAPQSDATARSRQPTSWIQSRFGHRVITCSIETVRRTYSPVEGGQVGQRETSPCVSSFVDSARTGGHSASGPIVMKMKAARNAGRQGSQPLVASMVAQPIMPLVIGMASNASSRNEAPWPWWG